MNHLRARRHRAHLRRTAQLYDVHTVIDLALAESYRTGVPATMIPAPGADLDALEDYLRTVADMHGTAVLIARHKGKILYLAVDKHRPERRIHP